ncbi:MAG: hypothetical protein HY941_03875 [Gammaproteobacteria bacterium]|nr:hypothetical protein [Gammaproteobacteria bacterium]
MNRTVSACLCFLVAMVVTAPAMADRGRDYKGHHGYREHPYDKHRHYEHREYRGHRYDYQGHWRSWDEWGGYYRAHPWLHEHGHYYRDEGHLMFQFCDPESGGCFFFSIGQ